MPDFLKIIQVVVIIVSFYFIGTTAYRLITEAIPSKQAVAEMTEKAKQDLTFFKTMLDRYKKDHGDFPKTEVGFKALVPKYLRYVELDPWGSMYQYEYHVENPIIYSAGRDLIPYTEDDVY